jgi:hypothetical protein
MMLVLCVLPTLGRLSHWRAGLLDAVIMVESHSLIYVMQLGQFK